MGYQKMQGQLYERVGDVSLLHTICKVHGIQFFCWLVTHHMQGTWNTIYLLACQVVTHHMYGTWNTISGVAGTSCSFHGVKVLVIFGIYGQVCFEKSKAPNLLPPPPPLLAVVHVHVTSTRGEASRATPSSAEARPASRRSVAAQSPFSRLVLHTLPSGASPCPPPPDCKLDGLYPLAQRLLWWGLSNVLSASERSISWTRPQPPTPPHSRD